MVMAECINTNKFNRNFVTAAGTTKDEQQATSNKQHCGERPTNPYRYNTKQRRHSTIAWLEKRIEFLSTFVHPAPQVKNLKQPLEQNLTES
jgi:hypothetical protein